MRRVLKEGWRTARKGHRCDSCLGSIEKGERYYERAVADDGFYAFKAHSRCYRATQSVVQNAPTHTYDDDVWPNVCDFESEDWDVVKEDDPETFQEFLSRADGYGPPKEAAS